MILVGIDLLRAVLVRLGYVVRPYDMLADRRRWRWGPRTRCMYVVLDEQAGMIE